MSVYRFPIPSLLHSTQSTSALRADVQRLLNEAFTPIGNRPVNSDRVPSADAREDATGFTLDLDVPGVAPDALEVLAEDGVMTVRGTPTKRELAEGETLVVNERAHGVFTRQFRLPKNADASAISASYANGVLTVRVAKVAPTQPRRVTITQSA